MKKITQCHRFTRQPSPSQNKLLGDAASGPSVWQAWSILFCKHCFQQHALGYSLCHKYVICGAIKATDLIIMVIIGSIMFTWSVWYKPRILLLWHKSMVFHSLNFIEIHAPKHSQTYYEEPPIKDQNVMGDCRLVAVVLFDIVICTSERPLLLKYHFWYPNYG